MAKYSATGETLGKSFSDFVLFEQEHLYTRETFTASGAVALGDVVTKTLTFGEGNSVTLYGIAAAPAANGKEFPAVVRGAVVNSGAYTSIANAAKKALLEQGVKIL